MVPEVVNEPQNESGLTEVARVERGRNCLQLSVPFSDLASQMGL